ncbi:MAG: hypothetical protein JXQ67_03910 [Campylobacterales bacterium]|nr:hypothetical protein [Campylobacterales bacterium]
MGIFLLGGFLYANEDTFKINIGAMHVTNFETQMQIGPSSRPIDATISTEDQLGMKYETNVFRLDGYYRFTRKHSVDFSYFSVKSDGERVLAQEIPNWGENGDTIDAGANVKSIFNMDIYKLNYVYSFYHNEDVELGLSLGLHITNLELGLNAVGSINGVPAQTLLSSSKFLAPLPVVGFRGEYAIIPQTLYANYQADYLYLRFDNFEGSLVATELNVEYRFLENYGVGLGYNSNTLAVAADNGDVRIKAKNNLSGAMFYLSYNY